MIVTATRRIRDHSCSACSGRATGSPLKHNATPAGEVELQSAATASKSAQPAAAQDEIERLRGELDALMDLAPLLLETSSFGSRAHERFGFPGCGTLPMT
jgi:hypothetical protein